MDLKRLFFKGVIFLPLFLLTTALASAASIYSISDLTGTVGTTNTNLTFEYTVDTASQTWADGDALTLTVPPNFPTWLTMIAGVSVEYDQDVDNDGVGETAITAGGGNGQFTFNNRDLAIKWDVTTWGAVINGASTIRVIIATGAIPSYANDASPFTFGGGTANGGDTNPLDEIGDINIVTMNVSPANANASITLGENKYVGNDGTTTLTMTSPTGSQLLELDEISFTMPSNFTLTGFGTQTPSIDDEGGIGLTCTASGQVVTCVFGDTMTANTTGTIALTGIYSTATVATQTITDFVVVRPSATDAQVTIDTTVAVDEVIGGSSAGSSVSVNAPSAFAVEVTESGALLTWTDPSEGSSASKIEILRGLNGVPVSATPYDLVALGTGEYLDTSLVEGDVVSYIIRARDNSGINKSSLSSELTVTFSASTTEETTEPTETPEEESTPTEETTEEESSECEVEAFSDLSSDHWAYALIMASCDSGLVTGYSDGTFAPDSTINRAEGATLIERIRVALGGEITDINVSEFSDVEMGEWYANAVLQLAAHDIITGNPDGTFAPAENINRAEFLAMAMRLYVLAVDEDALSMEGSMSFEDVSEEDWFYTYVSVAFTMGVVEGKTCDSSSCFAPNDDITRAEALAILDRLFGSVL